jgi:hypothetical protein
VYVHSLGPAAFPALDRLIAQQSNRAALGEIPDRQLVAVQKSDQIRYRAGQQNWRAWSFRDWRLLAYLDRTGPLMVSDGFQPNLPGR